MLFTRGKWRLTIVGFTLLAYIPTLPTPFLFDDHAAIERNESLRRWSFQNLYSDFHPSADSPWGRSYYRPLQMISHRVDVTIWGMKPMGHHGMNLLLHLLAALLLFELVIWIGLSEWAAGICAVLFGIHPIIVSELLMVSGRPEILSLVFSLAAILLLTRLSLMSQVIGGLCFLAGLLSKETALVVPFYVGLVIWIRGGNLKDGRLGLIVAAILGFYGFLRVESHTATPWAVPLSLLPGFLAARFPLILMRSAEILIAPWPLYLYRFLPEAQLILGLAAWALIGGIGMYGLRSNRWMFFGWVWFIVAWIPKIPVMPGKTHIRAELADDLIRASSARSGSYKIVT